MKLIGGLVSLLVAMAIGLGIYYIFLKQASPAGGGTPTQVISTTRVEMDLSTIANAERSYYAQNSSYGTMDQLVSGGELPIPLSGRDGYTYTMDASSSGFTVTAKWAPQTRGAADFARADCDGGSDESSARGSVRLADRYGTRFWSATVTPPSA